MVIMKALILSIGLIIPCDPTFLLSSILFVIINKGFENAFITII